MIVTDGRTDGGREGRTDGRTTGFRELDICLSSLREARAPEGRPSGALAFDELRRYHTRPSRLNWGPEKSTFWENVF